QSHVLAKLGEEFQQAPEGTQPIRQAFGVVETVYADDLLATQHTPAMRFDLDFFVRLLRHFRKSIDIDANRKATCDDLAVLDLNPVVLDLIVELVFHIMLKIAEIGIGLEANDIELKQALDQPTMLRHCRENLWWREGDVEEESDPLLAAALAQFGGKRDEVIVVDPDYIIGLQDGHQRIGEFRIHAAIAVQEVRLVLHKIEPVVK